MRHIFQCLWMAYTKTFSAQLMDVSRLWDLNKKKVEELLYLLVFGVLEVKHDLDRTGMHFLDQQRLYVFWTTGLTTVEAQLYRKISKSLYKTLMAWFY